MYKQNKHRLIESESKLTVARGAGMGGGGRGLWSIVFSVQTCLQCRCGMG